ncbi:MAG TPA: PfkB family carbohydrate kinase [Solirubrobacteraceae bacterium]|nr:PfkB family carbohydrate kinase [Solirubrobacteraceae bacterium]
MIVCVAGNPAIDKLFEVGELAPGMIHRPDRFVPLPGGKGIHVAQVVTALGGEAIATGILGGHAGRWLAQTLAEEGVMGRFAWAPDRETRSCLTVADRATGGLTEFYEDGIRARPEEWSGLTGIVEDLLSGDPLRTQETDWLAMAGSVPAAVPLPGYADLIARARSAGVRSAIDSRGPDLARALESEPDLVKINAYEAGELLDRPITEVTHARAAAMEVRARAGGEGHAAIVTVGEQGMVLVEPDGATWHGTVGAHGNYPVGSGDAFLAGLLTALAADPGLPWAEAVRLGLGAAAANAEVPGAARLDPARAQELARAAEVVRI